MVSELSKKKHGFNRTAKTGPGRKGRFNYRTESKMDDQASPSSLTSSRASSKTSPWTPSMTPPPLPEPTTTFQSFQLEKFGDYEGSESDVSTWRLFNAVFFGGGGDMGRNIRQVCFCILISSPSSSPRHTVSVLRRTRKALEIWDILPPGQKLLWQSHVKQQQERFVLCLRSDDEPTFRR